MRPEVGSFVYVVVALDRLQEQFKARTARVVTGAGTALWVELDGHYKATVALDEQDESITWCHWGQRRTMDALEAVLALGARVHQYAVADGKIVVVADKLSAVNFY